MATIRELAEQLYDALETAKRPDGTEFIRRKQGSPEWMQDVIREAHGDKLPDDSTYEGIQRCLSQMIDCTNDGDGQEEMQESLYEIEADVYTSDLTAWLHADCGHVFYLEEAMKDGCCEDGFQLLAMAQAKWLQEIGNSLITSLADLATDENEDTDN